MKIKSFCAIFTPLFIYWGIWALTTNFTRLERYMFILLWLLVKCRYVWDDEKPVRFTWKWCIICATLIGIEKAICAMVFPLALKYSNMPYEEANTIMYSADHLFLCSVFFAPLIEEWLFRGIGIKCCIPFFKNINIAIFVQAILFGIMHFNLYQGLAAMPFGLINGYLYKRYKSLKLCIALHAIYNLCVIQELIFPG